MVKYRELFSNVIFDESFKAQNYIGCTFDGCIFKDVEGMNVELLELFKSDNKIVGCWYNPVLIFNRLFDSLHDDVNLLDQINKAFIRSSKDKHSRKQKSLVLIDIDVEQREIKDNHGK